MCDFIFHFITAAQPFFATMLDARNEMHNYAIMLRKNKKTEIALLKPAAR